MRYVVLLDNKIDKEFVTFDEADRYVRLIYPEVKWEKIYFYVWYATESPVAIVELPYHARVL